MCNSLLFNSNSIFVVLFTGFLEKKVGEMNGILKVAYVDVIDINCYEKLFNGSPHLYKLREKNKFSVFIFVVVLRRLQLR